MRSFADFGMDLTSSPTPLTPRQRMIVWTIAAICAGSRFLAMARSIWDWDEALFCLGMRSYDVASHHPHPPGFPIYIAMARLLRLVVHDDFRALQSVNLIAGMFVFPAVFLLARELRFRFTTATVAAALCAFFPNVWFFGGTAFSDVPSIVLVCFAAALLFRGCRDGNAYLAGTFLLALAIGIRPQNLLVGLFPGILATWYRARTSFRDVVFALIIGVATCGVAYFTAMWVTGGWTPYFGAIQAHSDYIARIDSFRSSERPPLWRLFDRFFIKQYQSSPLSVITSFFVLVSAVMAMRRRDARIGYAALTFAPFAIMAWLMLDRFSINRFSIGYIPMFALLAADGIARLARGRQSSEIAIASALVLAFIAFTLPALTTVRNDVAPSVLAVRAVRQHLDPKRDQLFVAYSMTPFLQYFEPYWPFERVMDERALPLSAAARPAWLLTELDWTYPSGVVFRRDRDRLWNITRRHYFEVALVPFRALPRFVSGWYDAERAGLDEWRWMARHSVTILPPATGTTRLRLTFDVPDEVMPQHPSVTITLNGTIVDRFVARQAHLERDYDVAPAPNRAPNTLVLDVDRSLNPAKQNLGDDARELGLLVRYLSWGPG